MKSLGAPVVHGTFDYPSNLVVLDGYNEKHKTAIEALVNSYSSSPETWGFESRLQSILIHEFTHFLDFTTTVWGVEYIYRKALMLSEGEGGNVGERAKVFMINTLEIEIHEELVVKGDCGLNCHDSMTHGLLYNEKYGVVVMIQYNLNGRVIHEVPLSMLSVLEANAIANEYLSRISYSESAMGEEEALVEINSISRDLDKLLDDQELSEYTVLISLVRKHFEFLNVKESLFFVCFLSRFCLDMNGSDMSRVANVLERMFGNWFLGNWITVDLRRGGSRPIIFFKSVLLMYGWLRECLGEEERRSFICLLKNNPKEAIARFWKEGFGIEFYELLSDFEFSKTKEWLSGLTRLKDGFIVEESSCQNRGLLKTYPPGVCSFHDLKLIDVLLMGDVSAAMPNRINLDVVKYQEDFIDAFMEVDNRYNAEKRQRFHMNPDEAVFFRMDMGF